MGENTERCGRCRHPLAVHDPATGCTDRVPGTRDRIPGLCGCEGPGTGTADVLPFRRRRLTAIEDDDPAT
jgi:hypothetical protein